MAKTQVKTMRAALAQMCGTAGWSYAKDLSKEVVREASEAAIDELDREKAESLRMKAQALKEGFKKWIEAVERSKEFDDVPDVAWIGNLQFDEELNFDKAVG